MKINYLSILTILTILILPLSVFSIGENIIGNYNLYYTHQSSWQNNIIKIESVNDKEIKGIIGLDFNIGPEARSPMDWEKMNEIPFKAKYNSNTDKFSFSIEVPLKNKKKAKYEFIGYFISHNSSYWLAGIIKISGKDKCSFVASKINEEK